MLASFLARDHQRMTRKGKGSNHSARSIGSINQLTYFSHDDFVCKGRESMMIAKGERQMSTVVVQRGGFTRK